MAKSPLKTVEQKIADLAKKKEKLEIQKQIRDLREKQKKLK